MEENNFNANETEGTANNAESSVNNIESSDTQRYNIVPAPSNGTSTAALVLGIVSLAMSIFCCGGGFVSIVCGIIGLVLGIPQMRKDPNDEKAKAGVILSAIGLGLAVFVFGITLILSVTGMITDFIYGVNWL